jgi:hypothetical protein
MTARAKAAGATIASFPRMSRPGIHGDRRRHLVFVICGEPHLVVGDIPGLDADHAAPRGVAEIDHGGGLFSPGIPHHARRSADLFDDDAAAPPAIFNDASARRVEVDAVGPDLASTSATGARYKLTPRSCPTRAREDEGGLGRRASVSAPGSNG